MQLLPGVNGECVAFDHVIGSTKTQADPGVNRVSVWKSVSPFPIPQDARHWVKTLASDKQKLPHSKRPSHCLLSKRRRQMDRESPCASHISIFDRACSGPPKITPIPYDLICARPQWDYSLGENHESRPHETRRCLVALWLLAGLLASPVLLCISQN